MPSTTHPSPLTADLRIGPVHLGFPVVQAALSGYSDLPMRVLARRMGASYALCEVVLDKLVLEAGRNTRRRYMNIADEEHPVGGQLMGADPEQFAPAAKELAAAGCDVVDINFGCPVPKVLGRCRGGFLLSQPGTALEIVARVRDAVPPHIPVTVKMRRGLDDTEASRDRFFTIFDGAYERGVAAITVHGRTVEQRYIGPSRWSFLAEVKQHAGSRTVLGSGDLFSAADCLEMIRQTGVDGVTVARGAIGNPWIFAQARALFAGEPLPPPPTVHQQRDMLLEHERLVRQVYPEKLVGGQLRRVSIKYAQLHADPVAVRDAFVKARRPEQWRQVLDTMYAEDRPGNYLPPPDDKTAASTSCDEAA